MYLNIMEPDAWRDHSHTREPSRAREGRGDCISRPALRLDSNRLGAEGPLTIGTLTSHQGPQFPQGEMVADGGSLRLMGQKGMSGRERLDVNLPQRLRDELWLGRMLEPHGGGTGVIEWALG